jgi:hypothetical protein
MHRLDEAEPLLLATIASLRATRGEDFYVTQAAIADLRDLYSARGDATNAALWAARVRQKGKSP